MLITCLGLRITEAPNEMDEMVSITGDSLPSSDKRVSTNVVLTQKADHYVGKLLKKLEEGQTVLAIGPAKANNVDACLAMRPMLVVTQDNFDDLLAINIFMACGGLGPKSPESEVGDSSVANRGIAWQNPQDKETIWTKLTAWNQFSKQLAELPNGTPTIAAGRISTSEKDDKKYLNYNVEQITYLPKGTKSAPNKASDPEKSKVNTAALGNLSFDL